MTTLQGLGFAYRKTKVDVLFVPEWDKDTESFNTFGHARLHHPVQ